MKRPKQANPGTENRLAVAWGRGERERERGGEGPVRAGLTGKAFEGVVTKLRCECHSGTSHRNVGSKWSGWQDSKYKGTEVEMC